MFTDTRLESADEVRDYLRRRGAVGHAQALSRDLAATAIWPNMRPASAIRKLKMIASETRRRNAIAENPYSAILFCEAGIYIPSHRTPEADYRVCREWLQALSSPLNDAIRDLRWAENSFKPEPDLFEGENR